MYGGSSGPRLTFCSDDWYITALSHSLTLTSNLYFISNLTRKKCIKAYKIKNLMWMFTIRQCDIFFFHFAANFIIF